MKPCPYAKKCGGCDYQGIPYEKQLEMKQKALEELKTGLRVVLARGSCKTITRQEVHELIDEIFDDYEG